MSALTTVIVIMIVLGALLIGLARQKRYPRVGKIAGGLTLTYVMLVTILVSGELYLRYGYGDSRMEFALHGSNWENRYIQRNSLGYRDREWTMEDLNARQTIFVLGDSFSEGWGLNDPADRYADVLQGLLGDDWAVVEVAKAGQSTADQQRGFDTYPYRTPDVVIWQYFPNDIDTAAIENGMTWRFDLPPMPAIAEESYLASFIYWRVNNHRLLANAVDGRGQWEYYYTAYDDPIIWAAHQAEIQQLTESIQATGAQIIVVMFPEMSVPLKSKPYLDRVQQTFNALGVTDVLQLYDEAESWGLFDRVVSRNDAHASVAFNHRVGQMIYDQFFAEE